VQDLAGTALSLEGSAKRLEGEDAEAAAALRRGAEQTRASVRSLRNLLVEIYPPSLQRAGLRTALDDLLAPLGARGVETSLVYDDSLNLDVEHEALLFRVTGEALRNALKHAAASHVWVTVAAEAAGTRLEVIDDGRGFEASPRDEPGEEGHIGTDLMADLAAEAGAELEIDSTPGRGTAVRLTLPA